MVYELKPLICVIQTCLLNSCPTLSTLINDQIPQKIADSLVSVYNQRQTTFLLFSM